MDLTRLYVRLASRAGQTMAEYALIMAAIAVVCITAYDLVGTNINVVVNAVAGKL